MSNKRPPRPDDRPTTPLNYIKTKARKLPIYKCFISNTEHGLYTIVVARKHTTGKLTYGAFLIDAWCLGVKDSLWQFNQEPEVFQDFLTKFYGQLKIDEISYTEAHNRIYGAIAWAEEVGIHPGKGWEYTQYLLEEDTDDIELIEYPFGDQGLYHLCVRDTADLKRFKPILDHALGAENYKITYRID